MTNMKERILKTIEHYSEVARNKGYEFPKCVVLFDLKGATAGQAFRRTRKMRFNLALADRHPDQFLSRTVPHEMAHILQFMHYPESKPHGREWDYFCRVLTGATMPRCHNYDTTGIKRQKKKLTRYKYVCDCNTLHMVTSIKHNRIQNGDGYRCVRCKSDLRRLITTY